MVFEGAQEVYERISFQFQMSKKESEIYANSTWI